MPYQLIETNTVIIGASAAGLATAARLKRAGVPFVLLEKEDHVAHHWRNHYDRLHLHTSKSISQLPFTPLPADWPRYVSREHLIQYYEKYVTEHDLQPRFGQRVQSVDYVDGLWRICTQDQEYHSQNVVIATGYTHTPKMPNWPGMDDYRGEILHSSAYKNGQPYKGQTVLVVGFGNSAGEIALDLHEHGAHPVMAVRSPVNVVPRDLFFGIPALNLTIYLSKLPPRLADMIAGPIQKLRYGDIEKHGLKKSKLGTYRQMQVHKRVPLIDIGTIQAIRRGHIKVRGDIQWFTASGVVFADGSMLDCDAVILGTGYHPALQNFLKPLKQVADKDGIPHVSGAESAMKGLYFIGFEVASRGMLYAIYHESESIVNSILMKS